MKTGITFLSYIGTLGVGVGIGVLCSKVYFEKRESERADAEIRSMKEAMKKFSATSESQVKSDAKENVKNDIPSFREYHTLSSDIASTKIDDVRAEDERPRDDGAKKPYFIDIDDFDEPTLGYAKKELLYYMEDGTLVDEGENVDEEGQIISIVDTVGTANLESFENSLDSCCYIRNESLKEDYEIAKVFGSYGALIEE